jgi:hypothetical protein
MENFLNERNKNKEQINISITENNLKGKFPLIQTTSQLKKFQTFSKFRLMISKLILAIGT